MKSKICVTMLLLLLSLTVMGQGKVTRQKKSTASSAKTTTTAKKPATSSQPKKQQTTTSAKKATASSKPKKQSTTTTAKQPVASSKPKKQQTTTKKPKTVSKPKEQSTTTSAKKPTDVSQPKTEASSPTVIVTSPSTPSVSKPKVTAVYSSKTYTVNGVSFKMIAVDSGTFTMGATSEQSNGYSPDSDERPTHRVTLSDYSIGETEVTQALWYAVMGASPSSDYSWSSRYGLGDDYPAYYISWTECQTFIRKLNALTGRTFRMPTEAEWEYAARGGNRSKGYVFSGSNTIGDVAWYTVNSYDKGESSYDYGTHEVATKAPNELGLYDMTGNVWEWCSDWYDDYSSASQTNPTGPSSGSYRVDRGGGWSYDATICRVAGRGGNFPSNHYSHMGLRLALQ